MLIPGLTYTEFLLWSDFPIWCFFSKSLKSSSGFSWFCFYIPIGKQNTDWDVIKPPSWPESVVALTCWLFGRNILFQCWCLSKSSSCYLSKRYRFFSFNSLHLGCWIAWPDAGRLKDEIWWVLCSCFGDVCTCLVPPCIPPNDLLLLLFVFTNGLALVCICELCCYWMEVLK